MYLERLELHGFKSFAKRTILEFPQLDRGHKGITAIVGPNGSGKSNISDAIRWVLGEQSLKSLRSKRSEDIIFSGSEKKGRLNMTEVSLSLNNEDRKAPIEYSELNITRRMFRDGTSEYLLNRQPVRLQDILLLLAKAQFGQKSYSVIGQGMIDAVLNASVQERKDFFYEATGVKQYQMKKDNASHKLFRTRENLQHVEITLQEIEPHLRSLERQMKRLEQREAVEHELRTLQKQYFQGKWNELQNKMNHVLKQSTALQMDYEGRQHELSVLQQELIKLEESESRSTLFDTLQDAYQRIQNERNALSQELSNLKGKLDLEYEKIGKLNVVWIGKRIDEIDACIQSLQAEHERIKDQLQMHERLVSERQAIRADIEDQILGLEARIHEMQKHLHAAEEVSLGELRQEIEQIVHAQKNFLISMEQVHERTDIDRLKSELKTLIQKTEVIAEKLNKSGRPMASEEMTGLQKELQKFLQEKHTLLTELGEEQLQTRLLQEHTERIFSEIHKLEQEKGKLQMDITAASAETPEEQESLLSALRQEKIQLDRQLTELDQKLSKVKEKIHRFNTEEEQKKMTLIRLQKSVSLKRDEVGKIVARHNDLRIELTKFSVYQEELEHDVLSELGDRSCLTEVSAVATDETYASLLPQIERLKQKLERIGGIDEEAVKEYQEVKERHDFLHNQYQDLMQAIASLEKVITELDIRITRQFHEQFRKINLQFEKYFKILFGGGSAVLTKVMEDQKTESESALSPDIKNTEREKVFDGIDMKAVPPGKKVQHLTALSGGEKALTSIALICAIIATNPSPFVVLDEVDAALDEANSEKFSEIVEQLSHKTQFIVITHNRATMRRAHILYGVTAGHDSISQLLSLKLEDAERIAKR